ncbi:hypothetical protein Back11_04890 [Paenibacillus baekrokdamisoli]|uniref:Uncharacterized protein n=1 Tax=Paenibacillus baekrokdamisoli TaxID=1712516 RepID=A0A3G9J735_9BACL|nr:hypothetical protein [Paenibacillus baekrokdamisoli]MBB3067670.1 hypothetical protein [Paenibacillus baekrokdamisoli]BBH19144.1 hypothetical protein Back11_04890 [Paenibacillus baekrokdamisoli]
MNKAQAFAASLGLPAKEQYQLATSEKRFEDGAHYRVEIPSVEGPAVMESVIAEAKQFGLTVNRVSQGSGIMLLSDSEIRDMAQMGIDEGIEVCLFVGPRMSFDIGAMSLSSSGKLLGGRHAGMDQLLYGLEEIFRAAELGIRSVLVADEGLLWLIDQAKSKGQLPSDLVVKISALMSPTNPVSSRILTELGGTTLNVPGDSTLPQLSSIRTVVDAPIDLYVESPDDLGGFIRNYEIPEIVRVASPVYLKFGLRNATSVYPSGVHNMGVAIAQCREKVRRAHLGLQVLERNNSSFIQSGKAAKGLGIPVKS